MSTPDTITVDLGDRSYPIVIGSNLLAGGFAIDRFISGADCLVVTNETVEPLYLERLLPGLGAKTIATMSLPDGEAHKTLDTASSIFDRLVEAGANRDTTVIALGGGVVGDISGFAASAYLRGVDFIQVPTTLLAQVDSSVGGKTGVNHSGGKNFIGAFHQPQLVLIDTDTLKTLPDRELIAGIAEVIKYGAISDAAFFDWLEQNMDRLLKRDPDALAVAIRRSCELKAEVVADDEREAGRRAILNFGHTFGHAIERSMGFGTWLHGEAVAAGMIMAAALSDIPPVDVERLKALVGAAGLPVAPPDIAPERWMAAMGMDKKVRDKQLRFVLLESLGSAIVTTQYDPSRLEHIIGTAG